MAESFTSTPLESVLPFHLGHRPAGVKRVLGCCHDLILAPRSRQGARIGRGDAPHCYPLHWQTGVTRPTSAPRRVPKGPVRPPTPPPSAPPDPTARLAEAELWARRMVSRTSGRAAPLIVFPLLSSSFPFPGSSEPYKSLGTPVIAHHCVQILMHCH